MIDAGVPRFKTRLMWRNCHNSQRFCVITSLHVCVKIYYSQKELKPFGFGILVIQEILEYVFFNIFKYIL